MNDQQTEGTSGGRDQAMPCVDHRAASDVNDFETEHQIIVRAAAWHCSPASESGSTQHTEPQRNYKPNKRLTVRWILSAAANLRSLNSS